MTDIARTLVVRSVEPGISDAGRVHAVVTVRDPAGVDGALHLFTSDPALAACLVAGAELELRLAADRRCSSCRWRGTEEVFRSDATTRECLNPNLGAEPMAEPGACFGGVAVEPTFGCLQWEAKLPRG